MSNKKDVGQVLYVVEFKNKHGTWEPAWDGDGAAHVRAEVAEHWRKDDSLICSETRLAVYVRAEEAP